MVSESSLFSRARPGKCTPRKTYGFLALPGELRNQVYDCYFTAGVRCEIAAKGTRLGEIEPKVIELCLRVLRSDHPFNTHREKPILGNSTTLRVSRQLGRYNRVQGLRTNWLSSLCALTLVCKQIHRESLIFLYHQTTFAFDAPNRIRSFLITVPGSSLSHVTKLDLHYTTYGSPSKANHALFQEKHRASWLRICKALAKQLINLQGLRLSINVSYGPIYFDLRQDWLRPFFAFRKLAAIKHSKGFVTVSSNALEATSTALERVEVNLSTPWSGDALPKDQGLRNASRQLHQLYGNAISRAILGASEEEAMMELNEAWETKCVRWHHHLGFLTTGW